MTMIARDLMVGNEKLKELGFIEEGMGHNAIMAGFQGQRQWTDHHAERRRHGNNPEFFVRLEWNPQALHHGDGK